MNRPMGSLLPLIPFYWQEMEKQLMDLDAMQSQAGYDDLMFRQVLAHSAFKTNVTSMEEAFKWNK